MRTGYKQFGIVLVIVGVIAFLFNLLISPLHKDIKEKLLIGAAKEFKSIVRSKNPEPLIYKLKLSEQRINQSELDEMLDHFKHSPESVSLAFMMTYDFSYLDDLARFKDNKVAATMLAMHSADPSERLFWARHLSKLDPNNGAASMMVSTKLLELGRVEEAIEALKHVEDASSFNGNMGDVSALLPDLGKIISKNYTKALVFDDLATARMESARSLFPKDFIEAFSGRTESEIIPLAKDYMEAITRASTGSGFSIYDGYDDGAGIPHEFKVRKASLLSAMERALGKGASLKISSVSAQDLTESTAVDYRNTVKKREQMTEGQMQSIVDSALQSSTR